MSRFLRQPLKVLVVDSGGFTPPYDFALTKALVDSGVHARLILPGEKREVWQDPDGAPRRKARPELLEKLRRPLLYVRTLFETVRVARTWRPDVIHLQWLPIPLAEWLLLTLVPAGTLKFYTMHNVASDHEPSNGMRGWCKKATINRFDRIIVHSRHSFNALAADLQAKAAVIPHGVLDYYRSLVTINREEHDGMVKLLFIGSIKSYKGLDVLVEALPALAAQTSGKPWKLTVAGLPNYPIEEIQDRVKALDMDGRVEWILRHLSEREIANLLCGAHIVVLPYRDIDQSGVLLAAVGMRRAVVATNVGGFAEIIRSPRHGALVEPNDPESLASALAKMVEDGAWRAEIEEQMDLLSRDELSWTKVAALTREQYANV